MDVNGLVTAASEKINLELADGLLFTLYNGEMDIHFYILVCEGQVVSAVVVSYGAKKQRERKGTAMH
ncbi:hypothetical protein TNCV_1876891 [Trichonephila clavipes]|nr:hypothetical protein TNCV_1876891 [Trichonephila clavipes]